ncbi:MAG: NADH-quinone oxidoreductase subunit N [Acidobacteriaceae bacterium]|nr:NADH-quinone oxidoreductase subunit N [Acidobacteriaceae bacterium]
MTSAALNASLPLLALAATSVVVMIAIAIKRNHAATAAIAFAGVAVSFIRLWPASAVAPIQVSSLLTIDRYALVYVGLLLAATAAVILLAYPYLENRSEHKEEFYLLLLLAALGSVVLAASSHMVSFFLGLELLGISLYALISYPRIEALPLEAGIKYLVLAASSSAFLLFGLALIYVANGSMDLTGAASPSTSGAMSVSYLAGTMLVITGIGFKLAVVPFHLWTPDVYQGAPLPVTAFVATVSKGGVFAFLLRWLHAGSGSNGALLVSLTIIAIASMLAGNLLALRQTNVKRLLAYSSIAHMGYFLVAVVAGGSMGSAAATYYLIAYIVTILGAFGSLVALSSGGREMETFEDIRGLFWRQPALASVFTAMILSLAGIPLTGGFLGKFYVLTAGASATAWTLVIVLIISSTIGLVYYLRIIVAMFSIPEEPGTENIPRRLGITSGLVLGLLTAALFVLGVYPAPLWNAITAAAAGLG